MYRSLEFTRVACLAPAGANERITAIAIRQVEIDMVDELFIFII
jgi:hypothetical protein